MKNDTPREAVIYSAAKDLAFGNKVAHVRELYKLTTTELKEAKRIAPVVRAFKLSR
jgi:hypothetical protein